MGRKVQPVRPPEIEKSSHDARTAVHARDPDPAISGARARGQLILKLNCLYIVYYTGFQYIKFINIFQYMYISSAFNNIYWKTVLNFIYIVIVYSKIL